jgi:hypothetical protein
MIFEQMSYQTERCNPILLAEGRHLGFHWVILSYGTHPCAYVQIRNKEHPCYHKQYDDMEIEDLKLYGCLSYSRRYLIIPEPNDPTKQERDENGWWIGWDYARGNDYCGDHSNPDGKKWSTLEIVEEVMSVIIQLISKNECHDVFEKWTNENDYERDKSRGIIEVERKDNNEG